MENQKLSLRENICYGIGDVGANLVWTTVSMFLMVYYTDNVGLSAAVAGTFMMIARLLDGVSDIFFGNMLDKTNTKLGKARPWLLIAAPLSAIGLILVFNVPSQLTGKGMVAYAFITYTFLSAIAYTAVNLAISALLSLMTNDQKSRSIASVLRMFSAMFTGIIISVTGPKLAAKYGWGKTSIIYAVFSVVIIFIMVLGTKERVVQPVMEQKEKRALGRELKILCKNKYFIPLTILFVLNFLSSGLLQGSAIYYVRDVLGNENLLGLLNMVSMPAMLLGFVAFAILAGKFGKHKVLIAGAVIQIVSSLAVWIAGTNVMVIMIANAVRNFGMALMSGGVYPLVADAVDYGEWKNGVRQDGLTNSAVSFGTKVGTGLGTAFLGFGLEWGHYTSGLAVQSAQTISSIKFLYAGATVISMAASIICLVFLNIDKIYPQIEQGLKERRKQAMKGTEI